jgi:asparagine synthase (glutamine-hydrolysing)
MDGAPVDLPIAAMAESLSPRGRDGTDCLRSGDVALCHAHSWTTPEEVGELQPITERSGQWHITADACIDNREELASALGLCARDLTDAALILAAYQRWGAACCEQILGDYAFVIWDAVEQRLFAARDPFGCRVLYYSTTPDAVALATTITAVRSALSLHPELNRPLLEDLLQERFTRWSDETAFKNIFRIPQGHHLIATRGGLKLHRYYVLGAAQPVEHVSESDLLEGFRDLFGKSVRAKLRSVGSPALFLSGGMDSSAVAGTANQLVMSGLAAGPIRSYSSVSNEPDRIVEREYIKAVTEFCPALRPTMVERDDCWGFQEFADDDFITEEPELGRNRAVRFRRLGAAVQGGCKVALSGGWADQLLGAYTLYLTPELLSEVTPGRPQELKHFWRSNSVKRLAIGVLKQTILRPVVMERARRQLPASLAPPRGMRPSELRMYLGLNGPLSAAKRADFDRLTAHLGLEVRFPFLDRRLVDYVFSMPVALRMRDGLTKYPIREGFRGLVPEKVLNRRDRPPGNSGLLIGGVERNTDIITRLLSSSRLAQEGYVASEVLAATFARASTKDLAAAQRLFRYMSVEKWLRRQQSGLPKQTASVRLWSDRLVPQTAVAARES